MENSMVAGIENDNHRNSPYSGNGRGVAYFMCACCKKEFFASKMILFNSLLKYINKECLDHLTVLQLQEIGNIIEDPTRCQHLLEEIKNHKTII